MDEGSTYHGYSAALPLLKRPRLCEFGESEGRIAYGQASRSPPWQTFFCSAASLDRYNLRDMSRAAKLTLAGTSVGAIGIVALVHYQQNSEKAVSLPSKMKFLGRFDEQLTFQRQCMLE